mgnify:CR=1 FL=1
MTQQQRLVAALLVKGDVDSAREALRLMYSKEVVGRLLATFQARHDDLIELAGFDTPRVRRFAAELAVTALIDH